jgi:hypothetical protein
LLPPSSASPALPPSISTSTVRALKSPTSNASQGVTFTNAEQVEFPDYNFWGYPPHSGFGLIGNEPGPDITATFAHPQSFVGGFYSSPFCVDFTAYDSKGKLIGDIRMDDDYGWADPFWFKAKDISSIHFDVPVSGFLTLDDLSFEAPCDPPPVVPEPGSLFLLGSGLLAAAGTLRRKLLSSPHLMAEVSPGRDLGSPIHPRPIPACRPESIFSALGLSFRHQ